MKRRGIDDFDARRRVTSLCIALAAFVAASSGARARSLQDAPPSVPNADGAAERTAERRVDELLAARDRPARVVVEELAALSPQPTTDWIARLGADGGLEPRAQRLLFGALSRRPDAWRAALAAFADDADPDRRRTALRVLATLGDARDLPLVVRAAEPRGSDDSDVLAVECESTLARLIDRDRNAPSEIAASFLAAPEALDASLLHALGDGTCSESFDALAEIVDQRTAWQATALEELGRAIEKKEPPFSDCVVSAVRTALEHGTDDVQRQAALLAGRLEDTEAVPDLLEILTHKSGGARDEALWSLQHVSSLRIGPEPERWLAWYSRECEWWEKSAAAAIGWLDADRAHRTPRILNELAIHPLHRHELAIAIAVRIQYLEDDSRGLAAAALLALHSRAACPALVEDLSSADPDVRALALRLLRNLTGKNLPGDPSAWSHVL